MLDRNLFGWDLPPGCSFADLDPLPSAACPACDGAGWLWDDGARWGCPHCHGSGNAAHRDVCPSCDGTGDTPGDPGECCSQCRGECYL